MIFVALRIPVLFSIKSLFCKFFEKFVLNSFGDCCRSAKLPSEGLSKTLTHLKINYELEVFQT